MLVYKQEGAAQGLPRSEKEEGGTMFDWNEFRSWLENHEPSDIVGEAHSDACPIATWLKEEWGGHWVVGVMGYALLEPPSFYFPLPRWVQKFLSRVEAEYPESPWESTWVRVADALRILNEIDTQA
ncbi:MAG: hypothetical protein C4321_11125 [Chloroflexota bacterium]